MLTHPSAHPRKRRACQIGADVATLDSLERWLTIVEMPIEQLAAVRGCSLLQALEERRLAAGAALLYLFDAGRS